MFDKRKSLLLILRFFTALLVFFQEGHIKASGRTVLPLQTAVVDSMTTSPQKIIFETNRDGWWQIYMMNSDGSNSHNLTHSVADERDPAWSPDGQHIAFVSRRDGDWAMYIMDAD